MLTIHLPNNNRWLSSYMMILVDLSIYWGYRATVSARPIDIVMSGVEKYKDIKRRRR